MRVHITQFFLRLGEDLYLNNPMRAGNSQLKLMLVHFGVSGPQSDSWQLPNTDSRPQKIEKEKTVSESKLRSWDKIFRWM